MCLNVKMLSYCLVKVLFKHRFNYSIVLHIVSLRGVCLYSFRWILSTNLKYTIIMQITRTLYLAGDETQSLDGLFSSVIKNVATSTWSNEHSSSFGQFSGEPCFRWPWWVELWLIAWSNQFASDRLVFSNGVISTHVLSPRRFMALAWRSNRTRSHSIYLHWAAGTILKKEVESRKRFRFLWGVYTG